LGNQQWLKTRNGLGPFLFHTKEENIMAKRRKASAMKASHLKKGRKSRGRKGRGKRSAIKA
jgi:hypothetical protein